MDPRPIRRGRGRRAGAAAQAPRAGAAPSSDPRAVRLGCWPPCSAQKVTPTARAPQGRLPGSMLTDRWTISLDHLFLTVARTRQQAGRRRVSRGGLVPSVHLSARQAAWIGLIGVFLTWSHASSSCTHVCGCGVDCGVTGVRFLLSLACLCNNQPPRNARNTPRRARESDTCETDPRRPEESAAASGPARAHDSRLTRHTGHKSRERRGHVYCSV